MKRQTRLSKVTSERNKYLAQIAALKGLYEAALRAIESGNRCIEKADELLAHRDAELALADGHIEKLHALFGSIPE